MGLSAAAETLVGILRRVIITPAVYLRFLEFLHVDIHSTGHTLSRPWSRQPNDVMSEIVCAQLHNELHGRRHNTLQSHGLFALARKADRSDAFQRELERNQRVDLLHGYSKVI